MVKKFFTALLSLLISCTFFFSCKTAFGPEKSGENSESRVASTVVDNGTMMQYFHWYTPESNGTSGLWTEVKNNAASLADMGITALWLPPAYKGTSSSDVGYGVYDMYDLGEFNQKGTVRTKYGTKDQYLAAINAAHAVGINIYADVVFNHRANADVTENSNAVRVYNDNRNYEYGGDVNIDSWTGFTFPGRITSSGYKYSNFKWHWYHFDGVDYAQSVNGGGSQNAIFKFRGEGKGWDWEVDNENQNYDYLMYADLDMDHPEVVNELKTWAKWYVDFANLDGFRMDAVKHIKYGFFNDWISNVRSATGKELFTVGEFWNYDVGKLTNFIDKTNGCMSLFDAPMHMNFYQASYGNGNYDMGSILNGTLTKVNPMKSVSIVENHDTQPCQALESTVNWWFKPLAYALILLRQEGYPCVFYADLYGAQYSDKGYNINMAPVSKLDKLIKARKLYAYGTQRDYFDNNNVIGWTREGDTDHANSGIAVIMSDNAGGSKWMEVGKKFAGKQFYDYLGNVSDVVTINSDGWGEFRCDGGSVSAYVMKVTAPAATSSTILSAGFEKSEGFVTGTTANNNGWYINGSVATSAKTAGSYGVTLSAKGKYLYTPQVENPNKLTFKCKASSTTAKYTVELQVSADKTNWTVLKTYTANGANGGDVKSTATSYSETINLKGKYYIRWYVKTRSAGSFYIDEVTLTNGGTGTLSSSAATTTPESSTSAATATTAGFETSEGFKTGAVTNNNGWTNTGSVATSAKISGSYGMTLNAKGKYVYSPAVTNPGTVTFKSRASGSTSVYTVQLQYSKDKSTWTTAASYAANKTSGAVTTTAKSYSKALNLTGTYYIRWYVSARSAGSFYIDDISIK